MWWLIALFILALVAFFAIKFIKSGQQQGLEHQHQNQLDGTPETHSSATSESSGSAPSASAQTDNTGVTTNTGAGSSTGAATATAAIAGSAVAAASGSSAGAATSATTKLSAADSGSVPDTVSTGDTWNDVREMIKILNLDGPDARRLEISGEELSALRKGDVNGAPESARLEDVAARLRKMLA